MDKRVEAIRADRKVGRGSCSSIDECYSDNNLIEALDSSKIKTPTAAVKWARKMERTYLEQGLNARWGEDDDPQLKAYHDWKNDNEE